MGPRTFFSNSFMVKEFLSNCGGERGSLGAHLPRGPVGKIIETYPLKMDGCYVSFGEGKSRSKDGFQHFCPFLLASFVMFWKTLRFCLVFGGHLFFVLFFWGKSLGLWSSIPMISTTREKSPTSPRNDQVDGFRSPNPLSVPYAIFVFKGGKWHFSNPHAGGLMCFFINGRKHSDQQHPFNLSREQKSHRVLEPSTVITVVTKRH